MCAHMHVCIYVTLDNFWNGANVLLLYATLHEVVKQKAITKPYNDKDTFKVILSLPSGNTVSCYRKDVLSEP